MTNMRIENTVVIALLAKNKSDAPVGLTVQKYDTSRPIMMKDS